MTLTRREALALAAAAVALPAAGPSSLDALARARGIRFGSAIGAGGRDSLGGSFADPRYRALMVRECGLMVHENEMKWGTIRPDPKRFDFTAADKLMAWARAERLGVRGHTLLWHHPAWFPAWVETHDFGARPKAEAERLLVEHVDTVARRYAADIASFDVVNEAVDADTGALRETAFSRQLGAETVLDLAFRAARAAAPRAQLVYNDYMSWEPGNEAHRAGVLRLLEALRKRGTPVDALGIQGHIGTANTDTSTGFGIRQAADWRRFLDDATGMGYRLLITEFDVHDKGLPAPIPARDRAVADYAKDFLDLTLSYRQLDTLMCWGLSDRYNWLQGRWRRPDQLPKRPAPYDDAFRAKPLRAAIAAALRGAPAR